MRPILLHPAAAACAALLALAACGPKEPARSGGAQTAAQSPTAANPAAPALWRIEAINDGKIVRTVEICADEMIRKAFSHPTPEFKGQTCDKAPGAAETAGSYAVKCCMDHQNYVVSAAETGNSQSNFTVAMSVARQDKSGPTFEQTRHYAKVGPCPDGWQVGDTAAPGDKRVMNALAPSPAAGPAKAK